ncbi:MAG: di-trans,poly-cis-decaprenylcistransferase, partial [Gammaproteobacteria bacterium]|nr:di-trans,poly-cis-decaprenylcistransferase [Gammaproteobacteria bacterium]
FIGERSAFSAKLQTQMNLSEQKTANNSGLELSIAVNYGGRWDIVNAARKLAVQVQQGELKPEDISIERFAQAVSLSDLRDPDLFIRTGGEKRVSNYLLWHLAYTELYFTDTLWPDFSDHELDLALEFYAGRQRRFGKTGEQVEKKDA